MNPLKKPIAAPTPRPARIPRIGAQPCWTLSTAITPAARPLTAPTERSISPSSRTSTTPIEIVAVAAICRRQVREVDRREEAVVGDLEDRPDDRDPEHHPDRGEVAAARAPPSARRSEKPLRLAVGGCGADRRTPVGAHSGVSSVARSLTSAPVIEATICSRVVSSALNVARHPAEAQDRDPVGRPRRRWRGCG